jgi:hypothetical protein
MHTDDVYIECKRAAEMDYVYIEHKQAAHAQLKLT